MAVELALRASAKIDAGAPPMDLYPLLGEARRALENADMLAADAATADELAKMKKRPC